MKKTMIFILSCMFIFTIMVFSCGKQDKCVAGSDTLSFERIVVDTVVTLDGSDAARCCEIKLDVLCAKGNGAENICDSVAVSGVFTTDFYDPRSAVADSATLHKVVDGFVVACIAAYKAECGKLIEEGIDGVSCNYEYIIDTEVLQGKDSVATYMIKAYTFTGGAHGSTFVKALNFNKSTGRKICKKEFFGQCSDSLLNDRIVESLARKYEVDGLDGLREKGIFLFGDVYVPDNFILGNDSVTFIYMPDEMAPHAVGEIRATVPYSVIDECKEKN